MTKETKILLRDNDTIINRPLTRTRSIFSLKNGIYSEIERLKLKYPESKIYFSHPYKLYEKLICKSEGFLSDSSNNEAYEMIVSSEDMYLFDYLNNIEKSIEEDLSYFDVKLSDPHEYDCIGDRNNLIINETATIHKGVVFDLRNGVVVVDEGVEITPFTYISGPVYVGKYAKIDCAKIEGPTLIGKMCRIGGEIESSIFNDFSNKHHEGFVGHSIIGSWVNLGALTTTSDLKNNYGEVSINIPNDFKPSIENLARVSTRSIKFGSIIGDSVKTAIGTMINTGTVIDYGANVFGANPNKYTMPLSWGISGTTYRVDKFISDCKIISKRREQEISGQLRDMISLFI